MWLPQGFRHIQGPDPTPRAGLLQSVIAGSVLSAALPARCAFKATNCSSRRPPAPPRGALSLDCTLGTGAAWESGSSETRRVFASPSLAENVS